MTFTPPHGPVMVLSCLLLLPVTGDAQEFKMSGTISAPYLNEISGLTWSGYSQNHLWCLNDSGNEAALYLIDTQGVLIGIVVLPGARNVDWEDLTTSRTAGKSYLIIGDVGDNQSKRSHCRLIRIPEPDFRSRLNETGWTMRIPPETVVDFVYEDGARDCESVAIQPESGNVVLLSKRDRPPRLYTVPMDSRPGVYRETARFWLSLPQITPTSGKNSLSSILMEAASQPTSLDWDRTGVRFVVLTYAELILFENPSGEPWSTRLGRSPRRWAIPQLEQAEAVCFSEDGKNLWLTTEGIPAPIYQFQMPE